MAAKFCTECGSTLSASSRFCSACGAATTEGASPPPVQTPLPATPALSPEQAPKWLALAGGAAVIFAYFAQISGSTNFIGLPIRINELAALISAAAERIEEWRVDSSISPTTLRLCALLTYFLWAAPIAAGIQIGRELTARSGRYYRGLTTLIVLVAPIVAFLPLILTLDGIEQSEAQNLLLLSGETSLFPERGGGGWDDGTLMSLGVVGALMLVGSWLLSTKDKANLPPAPAETDIAPESPTAPERFGALFAPRRRKFWVMGLGAILLLYAVHEATDTVSEPATPAQAAAHKAAMNAAAIAAVQNGVSVVTRPPDSNPVAQNGPSLTLIGMTAQRAPGCILTNLADGVVVGEMEYASVHPVGSQYVGVLRLGVNDKEIMFNINSDFYASMRDSVMAEGILRLGPMVMDGGQRDGNIRNSRGPLVLESGGASSQFNVKAECEG